MIGSATLARQHFTQTDPLQPDVGSAYPSAYNAAPTTRLRSLIRQVCALIVVGDTDCSAKR